MGDMNKEINEFTEALMDFQHALDKLGYKVMDITLDDMPQFGNLVPRIINGVEIGYRQHYSPAIFNPDPTHLVRADGSGAETETEE